MIEFRPLEFAKKPQIDSILQHCGERGCEFGFANMYLWGRQRVAFLDGFIVFFCEYNRRTVYTYPVGQGDKRKVLQRIMDDAARRGISCSFTGLLREECGELEQMFPGKFSIYCDRDSFDYVYRIEDLALLKGRKYQRRRNQVNRFMLEYPDAELLPLEDSLIPKVSKMVEAWYADKLRKDPTEDFHLEQRAIHKALHHWHALGMEGLVLMCDGQVLAVTMGTFLSSAVFDVHFEKAREDVDGAYAFINRSFASYLHEKYPGLQYLNREDDMGIEGLRKAKTAYCPDHMLEKCWASLREDDNEN